MNTTQSSSFLAGEKLTTGSLSLSAALRPTIVFAGNTENEIRIAEDGIVFRGQKIVDAGQLYNVLRIAMDVEKRPIREQAAPSDIPMWWERLGCVRNPGAHTAEESARDGEIADLRATLLDQVAAWLPSGLAIVPVEPTEEMVGAGFESAPDEFFSPAEEWAAYAEMTGCQKAAYRARLCYAAMLAAAPAAPTQAEKLQPQAEPAPTDLSKQLRAAATADVGYAMARLLIGGAEEIERYYGGMMNWKANAQAKDRVNVEAWAHKVEVARATGLEEARQECESVLWAIENGDGMPDEVYGAERCRDAIKAIQCAAQASTAGGRQEGGAA